MLKLGGWPRLTWGIGPKAPRSGMLRPRRLVRGGQPRPSAGMRLRAARAVAHHSPLPAPCGGRSLWPTAHRGSEGQVPRRSRGRPSVIGLLTPMRQACPREGPSGATCVQRLDGSRDSAIHTKYRISLRSSSMREPRYPLPRVISHFIRIGSRRRPRAVRRLPQPAIVFLGVIPRRVRHPTTTPAGREAGAGFAEAAAPPRRHDSVTCAPVVSP